MQVHTTLVVKESLDPVWDSVSEFTVANINQVLHEQDIYHYIDTT